MIIPIWDNSLYAEKSVKITARYVACTVVFCTNINKKMRQRTVITCTADLVRRLILI